MARHLSAALLRRIRELRIALSEGLGDTAGRDAEGSSPPVGPAAWGRIHDPGAAVGRSVAAKRRSPDDGAPGAGDDVVRGRGGDDRVKAGAGDDRVLGGGGADRLWGGDGRDLLQGGRGADQLRGGGGADQLRGDGGKDRLWGGGGGDDARGGAGNDRIRGGGGADDLRGERGEDLLAGGAGDDRLTGGAGADRLRGGAGNDRGFGGSGADDLRGAGGRDQLAGGSGDDALFGGAGADLLLGGSGADRLFGGGGDDRLNPGDGAGEVFGGDGADVLELDAEATRFAVSAFDEGGRSGFVVTRLATGDEIRVTGVERVAYLGEAPRALKLSSPIGAPSDQDPARNRIREGAAEGEGTGVRMLATDPDPGDAVSYAVDDPRFVIDAQGVLRVAAGAVFDAQAEPEVVATVRATSSDGSSRAQAVIVDVAAPDEALTAALLNDTGRSATDGTTRDAALQVVVLGSAAGLTVAVDGGPAVDIAGALDASGRAAFTPQGLADGAHEAVFRLRFADGAEAARSVSFTLDRAAPVIERFGLAASSDTGALGDGATGRASVTLTGRSEAGAWVEAAGASALVDPAGRFAIAGVALPKGETLFQLTATDLAGNSATAALTLVGTAEAGPTPVLDWMRIALERIAADAMGEAAASRLLAMAATAMNDVAAAFDRSNAFLVAGEAPAGGSLAAAVAGAAHGVLAHFRPAFRPLLDQLLADDLAGIEAGAAASGQAFGAGIAARVIALRSHDGWDDFEPFAGSEETGEWRATGPLFALAAQPEFATMQPWALDAPDQVRPDGPAAPTSARYAEALREALSIGALDSPGRSAAQTQAARFWQDGAGTFTPPGRWIDIALDAAEARGLGIAETAELATRVSVSVADAMIAAWDAKYHHGVWRPSTAIRHGDEDGDAATGADRAWTPLLVDPAHPGSVSSHAAAAGAAAAALASVLGDATAFATSSRGLPGVERSYDGFRQAAQEAAESRVWAGVAFRFSAEDGLALGEAVAGRVLDAFDRGEDLAAPRILFDFDADRPVIGRAAATLQGWALDGLSGLAGLTASVEGGAAQAVGVGADGAFSVVAAGLGDGTHDLSLEAVDAAGNVVSRTVQVVLDAAAPTIALTSLVDGAVIGPGARLTGTADGTGSALASLSWSVDGGPARALPAGQGAADFDEALDLSRLAVGDHVIELRARDAAGNVAVETLTATLAAAPAFRATSLSPAEGDRDVGPTSRPKVEFSRPVDPATFDADSFFATGPSGARAPATVLLSADGLTGWMIFDDPLPGAARITLHLDGDRLADLDGARLDGDADGAAGGDFAAAFSTASLAPAPGTTLTGRVVDPGPDLRPGTTDDVSAGPDGAQFTDDDVFLRPIAGATVRILGLAQVETAVTDAQGRFELTRVPAGTVRVAVAGPDAPDGVHFPEIVLEATVVPGVENMLAGIAGAGPGRLGAAGGGEVYPPRLATRLPTEVSDAEITHVTVDAAGAPGLTDAQRAAIRLSVDPGALLDATGAPAAGGAVGLFAAAPAPGALPEGPLQRSFGVMIEAPGAAVFATPATLTLPNVFDAAPGSRLNLLRLDPASGRLVIEGAATVSEDGRSVTTDAGGGVSRPGWHGLAPPGGDAGAATRFAGAEDGGPDAAPGGDGAPSVDWGHDYLAVKIDGAWLRTITDADGGFELFLPAMADYELLAFDPASGLLGRAFGTTPASGRGADLLAGLTFAPSTGADRDLDGLADEIERAIGSSPWRADTDGDGVDDLASVRLGLDPRAGSADPAGPVAAVQLAGSVEQVLVVGPAAGRDAPLAVLRTATGLAVLDLADPRAPILLREMSLATAPTKIGFDPAFGRLTVVDAAGAASYALGDLIERGAEAPATALALSAAPGRALHVQAGAAYLGVGARIEAYDVATGALLASIDLGRAAVNALSAEGDLLAAVTADGAVVALQLGFGGAMTPRGAVSVGFNQSDLQPVLSQGVLHLPADNGFTGGYATVDLRTPDAPALLSGPDDGTLGGKAMALNGSGLGLIAGSPGGAHVIDLVDASNPQDTGRPLARFEAGAAPRAVAMAEGLGLVGLRDGRLLVVNPQGRDLQGVAPTVTLQGLPEDLDPDADGRQVLEGSLLTLDARILDDVQVARVQVLLDGRVVHDAAGLPHDFSLRLPTLAELGAEGASGGAPGGAAARLQVLAFDTGGALGASEEADLRLVPDAAPPTLTHASLADGDAVGPDVRSVRLRFSEPLDPQALDGAVAIVAPDGREIAPERTVLLRGGAEVVALFPQLPLGALTLRIEESRILDPVGAALGHGVAEIRFTVAEFNIERTGGGVPGRWSSAQGWSLGRVPQDGDDVLIDAPGQVEVRLFGADGSAAVASLVARDPLRVEDGATLRVAGAATLARLEIGPRGAAVFEAGAVIDALVIDRGRLVLNGDVLVTGRLEFAEGLIAGEGRLIVAEGATALLGDAVEAVPGRSYAQRLDLAAELELRGDAVLEHATLFFDGGYASGVDGARIDAQGALTVTPSGRLDLRGDGADLGHWLSEAQGPFALPDRWRAQPGGLTNDGLVRKTGGGGAVLEGEIDGAGRFAVEGGELIVSGRIPVSSLRGLEALRLDDGVLIMDRPGALARLTLNGGAVVGPFDLEVTEALHLRGGAALQGPGKVILAEGARGLLGDREAGFDDDAFFQTTAVHLWAELEARGALEVELAQVFFNLAHVDAGTGATNLLDGLLTVTPTGSLDLIGRRAELRPVLGGLGEDVRVDGVLRKLGEGEARFGVALSGDGVFDLGHGAVAIIDGVVDAAALAGAAEVRIASGVLRVAEGTDFTVAKLTVEGGALEIGGGGRLVVTERLDWTGGAVRGAGALEVGAAAQARLGLPPDPRSEGWPEASLTLGATLAVAGEAVLQHADVVFGEAADDKGAGRLEVRPGGTLLQLGHGAGLLAGPDAGGALVNEGAIIVRDGALRTQVPISGAGAWTFEDGAVVVTGGRVTLSGLDGAQAVVLEAGALVIDEDVSLARLDLRGGVMEGDGDVVVTELLAWTAGAMRGAGETRLAAGALGRLGVDPQQDGDAAQAAPALRRTLTVEGDVRHLATTLILGAPDAPDAPDATGAPGVVEVAPGGTWTFAHHAADIAGAAGVANVLRNDGALRKTGGGVSTVDPDDVALEGGGAVEATDGRLEVGGEAFGVWTPVPPAPRPGDPLTPGETLTLADGEALDALTLDGGALVLEGDARIEALTFLDGLITGGGDLTLGARFNWEGGRMAGAGGTTVEADAAVVLGRTWDRNSAPEARALQLDRTLTLQGDASLEQASLRLGGFEFDARLGAAADRQGRLDVAEGATLTLQGGIAEILSARDGFAALVNAGEVRKHGAGASDIGVEVSGDGVFVQADGPIRLTAGGVLTLDGGGAVDRLVVDGGTLVIEGDAVLTSLDLLSGRVEGAGALDISERLVWRSGTIAARGGVDLLAGAEGDFGSGLPPERPGAQGALDLETTLNLFGDAALRDGRLDLGRQAFDAQTGAVETFVGRVHVHDGAELTMIGPASDLGAAARGARFLGARSDEGAQMAFLVNDGVVRHEGGGRSGLSGLIDGDGAFVSAGPEAGFEVTRNGALVLDGSLAIDAVHVAGGLVSAEADATLARLTMEGGLVTGPGDLFVSDRLAVGASTLLAGPGRLVVQEGAQALFGQARDPAEAPASALLEISRDVLVEGEVLFQQAQVDFSGSVWDPALRRAVASGGALEVAPTGVLTLDGPGIELINSGPSGVSALLNHGSLARSGGGLARIGLDYSGGGALDAAGGAIAWTLGADLSLADLAGLTRLQVDGARVEVQQDAAIAQLSVTRGQVFGDGDLTVTDLFEFADGVVFGDGDLIVPAGAQARFGREADAGAFSGTPTLSRDVALGGQATAELAYLTLHHSYFDPDAAGTVSRGSTFTILPGGVLALSGAFADIDGVQGLSSLVNQGLLRKTGPGEATIHPRVDYREEGGTTEVLGGTLIFGDDLLAG